MRTGRWKHSFVGLSILLAVAGCRPVSARQEESRRQKIVPRDPWEAAEEDDSRMDMLREDRSQFLYTSRFMFRRMFHAPSRQATYWKLGGTLLGSAILLHNKEKFQEEFLEGSNEERREISSGVKHLGDAGTVPALALLLFTEGLVFRQPRAHRTGMMMLESAFYTALFTGAGQFILSEERPEEGGDLEFFRRRGHGVSGHAAIAASIAAPLSRGLFRIDAGDGRWARFGKRVGKGFAYGLPTLTGLSRIEDNKHYAWNVLLGLAIGFAVGDTVADAHDARREERPRPWVPSTVGPLVTEDGAGLGMSWRF